MARHYGNNKFNNIGCVENKCRSKSLCKFGFYIMILLLFIGIVCGIIFVFNPSFDVFRDDEIPILSYSEFDAIMEHPDKHVGDTLKIHGVYRCNILSDGTVQSHVCVIKDENKIDYQNVEFILAKGNYPAEDIEITIRGKLGPYDNGCDGDLYRLEDAVLIE